MPAASPLTETHPLLTALGPAAAPLGLHLTALDVAEGHRLFEAGADGDSLYLVTAGRFEVRVPDANGERLVAFVDAGTEVGELGLLTGQPRAGAVVAITPARVLRLSREGLDALRSDHPETARALTNLLLPRLRHSELSRTYRALLGELELGTLRRLIEVTEWQEIEPGTPLFRQGDPSDALYVVVHGRLQVIVEGGAAERVVGEIPPGGCVGELGLLTDDVRSATVTALRPSTVGRLARVAFERLIAEQPAALVPVARWVARRARSLLESSISIPGARSDATAAPSSIVILPIGATAAGDAVGSALTDRFARSATTLLLGPSHFAAATGRATAADEPIGTDVDRGLRAWLTEREQWFDVVVYVADPSRPHWTRRCLRQADRVVLVAGPDDGPALTIADALRAEVAPHAPCDLLRLHRPGTAHPQGTARLLEQRAIGDVFHARGSSEQDLAHVARALRRQARGVVLGGGGARGLAHVGVHAVAEEAGLTFDLVGGTSMGSIVGALIAMGHSSESLRDALVRVSSRRKLIDYTLPVAAFARSERLNRVLRELFGDLDIEDLWRPYFCVATNVTRSRPTVHTRGSLWRAVRSSASVPALYAPIVWAGDVLVDGGIMNNLPLDLMRARCGSGPLLAVDVGAMASGARADFPDSRSGWGLLWDRLRGRGPSGPPSLISTLLRTIVVNSEHHMVHHDLQRLADLVLTPDVQDYGLLDFDAYAILIDAGRRAAVPHRERLQAFARPEWRRG